MGREIAGRHRDGKEDKELADGASGFNLGYLHADPRFHLSAAWFLWKLIPTITGQIIFMLLIML